MFESVKSNSHINNVHIDEIIHIYEYVSINELDGPQIHFLSVENNTHTTVVVRIEANKNIEGKLKETHVNTLYFTLRKTSFFKWDIINIESSPWEIMK